MDYLVFHTDISNITKIVLYSLFICGAFAEIPKNYASDFRRCANQHRDWKQGRVTDYEYENTLDDCYRILEELDDRASDVICEDCGAINELQNSYCSSCGEPLDELDAEQEMGLPSENDELDPNWGH